MGDDEEDLEREFAVGNKTQQARKSSAPEKSYACVCSCVCEWVCVCVGRCVCEYSNKQPTQPPPEAAAGDALPIWISLCTRLSASIYGCVLV